MRNVENRVPQQPNKFTVTKDDGTSYKATIVRNDNPSAVGTNLDRSLFMAIQGMDGAKTTFNSDGSIKETYSDGGIKTTTFLSNGSIQETYVANGKSLMKMTNFLPDGSIEEVVVQ